MWRILNRESRLDIQHVSRRIAPMDKIIYPKRHIKPNIIDENEMMGKLITKEESYKVMYEKLKDDYKINESIIIEQNIELDTLRTRLCEIQRTLDTESSHRMHLENEINDMKTDMIINENMTYISKEELNNIRKESQYYQYRMEQERQLSRQLLSQIEEMKEVHLPKIENIESKEKVGESILSRACIVCSERHAYYEPMPCDHPICTECYVHWFASRMQYNETRMEYEEPVIFGCPLCRTPIQI